MQIHLIRYSARTEAGVEHGIAEVPSDRRRPSWAEAAEAIPGYVTGEYLGLAPTFTLRYMKQGAEVRRTLPRSGVERVGAVVMRVADRRPESVTDIAVLDESGADVTFNFACFAA